MIDFKYRCAALLVLAMSGAGGSVPAGESEKGKEGMTEVRYEDFGACGDGETDDSEAIVKAHAFANQRGLPVRASDQATYYIGGEARTVAIQTDTDFGTARFIIDDTAVKNIRAHIFQVPSAQEPVKLAGIASLKRHQPKIDAALPGRCLVRATNSGVKHFIRKGLNQNSGTAQNDVFLVAADGTVDAATPIQWDFDQITEIIAYPVDEKILTIKGGRFTTIANAAESKYTYYARGISISRSSVVVDGLEHRITGEGDHGAPYNGFISVGNCAEVTVRNTLVTGRRIYTTIGRANAPVTMGSYGISLNRALNITLENVKQTNDINDRRYWGIMGTNFCRNLLIEGCSLSRFDAHQGVYNATIRNSTIGHMGILAIGGGTLRVENTTVRARHFIGLRSDYGSTWRGDVIIRNCVFVPVRPDNATLITGSNTGDHDFGYPCTMPERITVDTLHIDDAACKGNYPGPFIFGNFNPHFKDSSYRQNYPYIVTREVVLKDVTTASGKPLRVSDNQFMFKDVVVKGLFRSNF